MIEKYHFGSIIINGKIYNHDVEVRWTPKDPAPNLEAGPTGQAVEVLKWWRKESHIFDVKDLKRAVEENPEVIILGTGAYGTARVTEKAQKFIKNKGITLIVDKTEEAVKTFNIIKESAKREEGEEKKIIGLFHLTC